MSKPSPVAIDASKVILMAVKISPNNYRVFAIQGWKVRSVNPVTWNDSERKYTCTCMTSRLAGKTCACVKLVDCLVTKVIRLSGEEVIASYSWRSQVEFADVVVWDNEKEESLVFAADIGDLSLEDLVFMRLVKTSPPIKKGFLNPGRIYMEMCDAQNKGIGVNSDAVRKTGLDCPKKEIATGYLGADEVREEADPSVDRSDRLAEISRLKEHEDKLKEKAEKAKEKYLAKETPEWKKVSRPDPKEFYVDKDVWEQLVYIIHHGGNILFTGPSGVGKTELCNLAAAACGVNITSMNMGAMSEPRTSLIGNTHFNKEKGTWFAKSRFVRAVEADNGVILLDELTRADRGAFNILLPLLDRQGYLALDESEDSAVVKKGAKVVFFATANIGMEYTGTEAMDKALKDRFGAIIELDFPPKANEEQILLNRCPGLTSAQATRLVNIAVKQRQLARTDEEFVELISTRVLLSAGQRIANGMSFASACKFCIENQFSSDGGEASERAKIGQIIKKEGGA